MPRRYTDEQIEERMVPEIVDALYPILIPMEQQDMRIQAENRARVTEVARITWRAFAGGQ